MEDPFEILENLFSIGDTETLLGSATTALREFPDDPEILAYRAYAKFAETIRLYKAECEDLIRKSSEKAANFLFKRVFLGRDEFYSDKIHEQYYKQIEEDTDSLIAALVAMPEEYPLIQELAAAAVRLLLEPASEELKEMRYLLSADDTFAELLLRFMDKTDLEETKAAYLAAYPKKKDRLPNQEKILASIEKLLV